VSDYEAAQKRRDVIVGIFVILGLAALGWMVFKFGDLPTAVSRMRSFEVTVRFPSAPGVQKDTPVRFCGYQIGRVTHVMAPRVLENLQTSQKYHQTVCILSINRQYTDIPSNVEVKLMTRGLGSSYIELEVDPNTLPAPPIDPNRPETRFLVGGMALQGSKGMTSEFFPEESQEKLTRLVDDIRAFIGNANNIIGDPDNRQNLKTTLANLTKASDELPAAIDHAVAMITQGRDTLKKFEQLATTGDDAIKNVNAEAEKLVASMITTSGELSKAFAQLRLAMEKVNDGQGTAGRLVNDSRLYEGLLESTNQLGIVLKDLNELINKVSEKGLRSIY
jgi:phospholipid/cholesterol/gamma-HCH transport system substrate-binding protein